MVVLLKDELHDSFSTHGDKFVLEEIAFFLVMRWIGFL